MATTYEGSDNSLTRSNPAPATPLPDPPDPPDPPDKLGLDLGKIKNKGYNILHLRNIPMEAHFDILATTFGTYGKIDAIRMDCNASDENWDAWISYCKLDDALKAAKNVEKMSICGKTVLGSLTASVPRNLDVYKPAHFALNDENQRKTIEYERTPLPPTWFVIKSKSERCNIFLITRHLQRRIGNIQRGDITRFGMNKVLVHARSRTQSLILMSMKLSEDDILKEITPHLGFSYGKGVIFNRELYDFPEQEILDMCSTSVWNVKKTKNNMIILTFIDPEVPYHIDIDLERLSVRPLKPRPMQCYNCYKYGHPSKYCKENKVCNICSSAEHGECTSTPKCVNCGSAHSSLDKNCQEYKLEEAALNKAASEHITIGFARKCLRRTKTYARAVDQESAATASQHAQSRPPRLPAQPSKAAAPPRLGANAPQPLGAPLSSPSPMGFSPLSPSPSEAPRPTTSCGVSLSSSYGTSDPSSSVIRVSPPIEVTSQAESLPDLMDTQTAKRGRPRSLSPPLGKIRPVPTVNRFEALDSDRPNSPPSKKLVGITEAQVHSSNTDGKKKDKKQKASHGKPSISRPDMASSNKSHKGNESRKK